MYLSSQLFSVKFCRHLPPRSLFHLIRGTCTSPCGVFCDPMPTGSRYGPHVSFPFLNPPQTEHKLARFYPLLLQPLPVAGLIQRSASLGLQGFSLLLNYKSKGAYMKPLANYAFAQCFFPTYFVALYQL